jgi:apolipoprotein N-acyltransferase
MGVARKSAAVFLSGIMLFCSFPPLEWSFCAWVALVPLVYLCLISTPGRSFRYGLIAGLVFWLASLIWLTRVSYIGWIGISLYCALYTALFALVVSWWHNNFRKVGPDCQSGRLNDKNASGQGLLRRSKAPSCDLPTPTEAGFAKAGGWTVPPCHIKNLPRFASSNLILLFGIPAIWVALEYVRAHFLTGFAWNMLGVSQYARLNLIQCAEWGGAYLVSCLIAMGNTAFVLLLVSMYGDFPPEADPPSEDEKVGRGVPAEPSEKTAHPEGSPYLWNSCRHGFWPAVMALTIFLMLLGLALVYGALRQTMFLGKTDTIQIAALQLNVPQQYKFSEEWANDIYRRLDESTAAASGSKPDLIVWPETALPDCIRYDEMSRRLVKESLGRNIPLLAGSMDYTLAPDGTNYYNSAFLYLPGQPVPQVYNKRHLVAFGEFIPFGRYLPFLRSITGIEEDFTPGRKVAVFSLDGLSRVFSVLICFEDTLPYLARDCVRAGARLLINQTNDAWFDPSWASRQHMIQCVFRCVENRVGCLRVTNTGITCLIDRRGAIRSELAPLGRAPRPPEVLCATADFAPEKMPLTFYTRRGDIFAIACAAFSLPLFLGALLSLRGKK